MIILAAMIVSVAVIGAAWMNAVWFAEIAKALTSQNTPATLKPMNDSAAHALTQAINGLTHELCSLRSADMVSRTDLAQAEARLAVAIGERWTSEDQKVLDDLSAAAKRKTLKLERLNSQYNPPAA